MSLHESQARVIVAIDPGKDKCGFAVLTLEGEVLAKAIIPPALVPQAIADALEDRDGEALIIGDRTAKQDLLNIIGNALIRRFRQGVVEVDEHLSSVEGRKRYLDDHPPRGLSRLLPQGLRAPAEPFDDYTAIVLAERYLRARRS